MTTSLIGKGKAFGPLPRPETIEPVVIHAAVGPITAIHQPSMTGESKGTVLFVPGFTGSKEDFYDLFPLLGEYGWDVWAISQRGQGDSVAPEGRAEYTREKTAGDVVEITQIIAQAQGVDRVHLLGHSFGGTVAQAALIETPIIFDSLTLMCSGPHGWPGRKADLRARLLDHPGVDLWRLDNPDRASIPDEDLNVNDRFLRIRSERTSHDQLIGAIDQLANTHDTTFEVKATGVPVLVFHGENDNWAWPQEWQRRMAELLDSRYEIIPNAFHCPNGENPKPTAALLNDFWTSVTKDKSND